METDTITTSLEEEEPDLEPAQVKSNNPTENKSPAQRNENEEDDDLAEVLMGISKRHEHVKSQLLWAESHLWYIGRCIEEETTPSGLRVNVSCQAMLEYYDVEGNQREQKDPTKII